jgi:hypothetical protein
MLLASYIDGFQDEIEKIAQAKKASAGTGALIGGMIGAGVMPKRWRARGAMLGGALGGIGGAAASGIKHIMEPSQAQIAAQQQQAWEPQGYVPSWQRAGF